jgi:hypothetical protein
MKKAPSVPAEYKELLDIMAEIIALDYLKNCKKDNGGKSDE